MKTIRRTELPTTPDAWKDILTEKVTDMLDGMSDAQVIHVRKVATAFLRRQRDRRHEQLNNQYHARREAERQQLAEVNDGPAC